MIKKYAVFSQKMFMYKLNFINLKENNWHGSKICLKKFKITSMVRNLKFKEYPFWRIDKIKNLQIIKMEVGISHIFNRQKIYQIKLNLSLMVSLIIQALQMKKISN